MTRLEFAAHLRGALRGLDAGEIEKSVQFYDELIADHMDEGMGEEDAVGAVGSPEDIAREVLLDQPVAQLVRRRVRNWGWLKGLAGVLIALGIPVWLPVLLAAVVVIAVVALLAYLFVLLIDLGFWTLLLTAGAVAVASLLSITFSPAGVLFAGVALASAGLAVFLAMGAIRATKGCWGAWRGINNLTKRLVLGRRGRNE